MIIPLPNSKQVKVIDLYTINNEPIKSIDLMERASERFSDWFEKKYSSREREIIIFCGTGNNGGDGLAVSRILSKRGYKLTTVLFGNYENCSTDCKINVIRLKELKGSNVFSCSDPQNIPIIQPKSIVIDALLGFGLDRPLRGKLEELIIMLNETESTRISIDIPSGLYSDFPADGVSFCAHEVLSFEFPKLAFLMPQNEKRIRNWDFQTIGLQIPEKMVSEINNFWTTTLSVKNLIRETSTFSHKGTNGTALLVTGQKGYAGAAILSSSACLKVGCGLLYTHLPKSCLNIVQKSVPETICDPNKGKNHLQNQIDIPEKTNVIGIGPGIGTRKETAELVKKLISKFTGPMVLDADALNIIAAYNLLSILPEKTILTPHPGEFRRLFGTSENDFEELELQRKMSEKYGIYIIFKGAYSRISTPEGKVYFNSSGNPSLAKAGSGDVLTGIITGLIARSYAPFEAAILGVHLHGLAADLAMKEESVETVMASDLMKFLGKAFNKIREEKPQIELDKNQLEPPV